MKKISPDITNYLQNLFGDSFEAFIQAKPEATAIRVNELKSDKKEVLAQLNRWEVNYSLHPINPHGIILHEDKIPISHTLLYFTGAIAYQGIASQLPVLALDPKPGESVLEMAASPGSKATQIAALLGNRGKLVLNDVSTNRLQALVANSVRCGVMNDVTLNLTGQRLGTLLPEFFDRVLLDAPCSALGTLAENSGELNRWWSQRAIRKFSNVQQLLLISAIKTAKVGGTIVYSTCSVAPEENEMLIQKMVENYPVEIEPIPFADAEPISPGFLSYQDHKFPPAMELTCRTFPHRSGMEGFFIAKLRKTDSMKKKDSSDQTEWLLTEPFDSPNIFPVLEQISDYWGFDIEQFQNCRFLINKKRLWITTSDWEKIPANNLNISQISLLK